MGYTTNLNWWVYRISEPSTNMDVTSFAWYRGTALDLVIRFPTKSLKKLDDSVETKTYGLFEGQYSSLIPGHFWKYKTNFNKFEGEIWQDFGKVIFGAPFFWAPKNKPPIKLTGRSRAPFFGGEGFKFSTAKVAHHTFFSQTPNENFYKVGP